MCFGVPRLRLYHTGLGHRAYSYIRYSRQGTGLRLGYLRFTRAGPHPAATVAAGARAPARGRAAHIVIDGGTDREWREPAQATTPHTRDSREIERRKIYSLYRQPDHRCKRCTVFTTASNPLTTTLLHGATKHDHGCHCQLPRAAPPTGPCIYSTSTVHTKRGLSAEASAASTGARAMPE